MELRRSIRLYLVAVILVGSLSAFGSGALYASDWPNWRGPDYNGISKETGWTASKINSNTKPLWKASVGTGFSSIAVSNGRAYTMGNTNNQDTVYCLDAEKGDVIWKHSYRAPLDSGNYEGGPSATPTVADGKVYTISKKGKVFCLDAATGDVIWQKELDVKIPKWGLAGSALVMDNMVIFNAGTRGMALNKDDGSVIWDNGKKAAGYATGVPFTSDGKKCVAMFGANEASGLIAATGKEIWSFKWKTNYDVNAADPIISGDKVFVSSGYNTGCGVFEINNGKAKQVWRNKNISNHFNSCVLQGGYVYGFDEKTLKCLDFNTGQEKWSKSGLGKGSLMAADGKLIILSEKGKLVIAEVSPSAFKEISSAQILSGKCWTMPVLANGRIYARNAVGDLVCVDVAPSAKPKAKTVGVTGSNDWPNWRGPEHNGISKETGWVTSKVNSSTKPLWKASVGTGFSSIAVSGGRAYTMGNTGSKDIDEKEHKDIIFCFDAKTGEEKWRYPYPCPLNPKNHEGGPSATPTVEGDRVYTLSKKGHVFCLNAKTGKVIWQKNLKEELGIELPTWDLAGSGLVVKDLLIFNAGTSGIALNKKTGEMVWQNGTGKPGYATAVEFKIGKQKGVAVFGQKALYGINIKDGTKFWEYPWRSHADENNGDPIFMGDKVYVSTLAGCALLKVEGDKVSEVWRNKNMKNHFNSTILVDGYFYGFDMSQLKCLDFNTGREKWAKKGLGKGSLMTADNKLIILSEKGKLVIAEVSPTGFKEISSAQILTGKCWTVPVLANGRIYARNAVGDLVCVDAAPSTKPKAKAATATGSNDWPNWRGPNYDGISTETGWVAGKIKEGVKPLWETGIETAFSSMTISNGLLYTMGNTGESEMVAEEEEEEDGDDEDEGDDEEEEDEDEEEEEFDDRDYYAEALAKGQFDIVFCLDAETGRQIWTYKYPALLEGRDYQGGPNATPTVGGSRVYTLSKRGKVFCFNAETGDVIWQKDLRNEFQIKTPYWGLASSPVIIDNMVIYNAGSYGIALDKNNGSLIWQNGKGPAGYASALPFTIAGQKCIAMLVHRELVGLVAATGKELWRVKWKTLYDENIPDVIISGDKLFASTGLGTGSALYKFDDSSLTKIWSHKKLQNHMNSSVLLDGYVYGIDGGGLVCLDFETGRVAWEQKGDAKHGSSLTLSDGKLIILTEKGKLIIAEASPKGYKEITSAQILSGRCWTVPVLVNGKIYARSNGTENLICLDVSGGSSSSAAGGGSKIWAQWRGPNRDGKSKETGLLKSWPDGGPKLIWSVGDLGGGFSTVAIANGFIYVTGMKGKEGVLSAVDLEGNLKWQKPYGPEWARSHPGVRSTTTVDGDSVYIMTGVGTVVCLDVNTGNVKWKDDVKEKFDGKTPRWGYAESLLIDGDKLICTPGGEKGSIVALDKRTGRTIWISKNLTEASAFCSPILIRRGSRKLVVTMLAESVVGVDAETGGVLWKDKFKEYQDGIRPNNPITPVYYDGAVYTTSGYDNGGALLALSHDGAKVTRKWVDTTLDTHHGGVVLVDGYIYGSNWKSNRNGDWVCLEWDTGKVMYETKWLGSKGSITYADGMLYCYEEDKGTVALVKASPKGFDIVSSFKVTKGTDEHWAHPVICDGRLYIRHGGTLMAYNVKG